MRSFERRVRNATTLKNVPSLDTIEKELERVGFIVIDNAFEENVSKECIKEIDEMHFKNVLTPGKIVDKVIDPKTGTYIKCIVPIIRYFLVQNQIVKTNV